MPCTMTHPCRMNPTFSIVVPAYNAGRFLGAALRSLQAQTRGDWEAFVVDDGSTDNTAQVALGANDARIHLLQQPNRGVSAARNRGFASAVGEYVIFLDADDELFPDALARYAGALDADGALSAVYGEGEVVDAEGGVLVAAGKPKWNQRPVGDVLLPLLRRNFILSGGALCARVSCVREAGPFREDLRLHEDWEHWCRLALTGPFAYLGPAPIFRYRRVAEGVVGSLGVDTAIAMANVDAVFENPKLRQRVDARQLAGLRRASEASVHSFVASQYIKRREWGSARAAILHSLRLQPLQPREWVLLACALLGWLPGPVRARVK